MNYRNTTLAAVIDTVCIVVFCAVGRRSHAEGVTLAGLADTVWPFLTGTAVGWLAVRGWRNPTKPIPTGVVIWLSTVVVGMVLRQLTGQGVAPSFIVVASAVTGVLLLGWRAAWSALR